MFVSDLQGIRYSNFVLNVILSRLPERMCLWRVEIEGSGLGWSQSDLTILDYLGPSKIW